MKNIILALAIFFAFSANAVEKSGFMNLASGKSIEVSSYGELNIPKELNFGRTFQIMYQTKISATDDKNLEKEALEILDYLKPTLDKGNYKTAYLRASAVYTGKMVIGKNGADFKFVKSNAGQWELKSN